MEYTNIYIYLLFYSIMMIYNCLKRRLNAQKIIFILKIINSIVIECYEILKKLNFEFYIQYSIFAIYKFLISHLIP